VWSFRNITDQKLAERELRKLSRAVSQSSAGIIITDIHGTIEYVNPKFI
jgi:PAS domain-containing protein